MLALLDDLRYKVRKAERKGVNVRNAFRHFDVNGSGSVDQEEFVDGLAEIGLSVSSRDAKKLFRQFRGGGKNEVDYHRFLRMVGVKSKSKSKSKRKARKRQKEKENRYDDDTESDSEDGSDYESDYESGKKRKKKGKKRRDY